VVSMSPSDDILAPTNALTRSLCVQALAALQAVPESDPLSYFQISGIHETSSAPYLYLTLAGIHGRPYTSWNNVPQAPNSPDWGYCTHCEFRFTQVNPRITR